LRGVIRQSTLATMLLFRTTQGIVIQTIRYSDSKLIIKLLCSNLGYKSCMVRSSKRPTNSTQHLFQPLRILEFETDYQEVNKFISIKTPRLAAPLHNLTTDPVKIAMTLFMDEVLAKTLADDYANDRLFFFLKNSILLLDDAVDAKNFHLWWLIEINSNQKLFHQIILSCCYHLIYLTKLFDVTRPGLNNSNLMRS
jgi:DNA repair protein RecO (recombination protein O)